MKAPPAHAFHLFAFFLAWYPIPAQCTCLFSFLILPGQISRPLSTFFVLFPFFRLDADLHMYFVCIVSLFFWPHSSSMHMFFLSFPFLPDSPFLHGAHVSYLFPFFLDGFLLSAHVFFSFLFLSGHIPPYETTSFSILSCFQHSPSLHMYSVFYPR
jgi:hypothetical protein